MRCAAAPLIVRRALVGDYQRGRFGRLDGKLRSAASDQDPAIHHPAKERPVRTEAAIRAAGSGRAVQSPAPGRSVDRPGIPKPAVPATRSSPVSPCPTDRFGNTSLGTGFGKTTSLDASARPIPPGCPDARSFMGRARAIARTCSLARSYEAAVPDCWNRSILASPQAERDRRIGTNVRPRSDKLYSTLGGTWA